MCKLTLLFWNVCTSFSGLAYGEERDSGGFKEWKKLQTNYMIHSRSTAYAEAPTETDSALSLHFDGKTAKEVFDQIGPDAKVKCGSEKLDRERIKKGVSCIYTAKLSDPKESHYTCWVGVNLRTGDGDVRVSC
jgi:hypothetical protein